MGTRAGWLLLGTLAFGCQEPENPFDVDGPRSCDVGDENEWLYDLLHEVYLWNEFVPELDPQSFATPADLIVAARYGEDRWSRVSDKQQTQMFYDEGRTPGILGLSTRKVGDEYRVSYVQPNSPADRAGIQRADIVVSINGRTTTEIDAEGLWGSIYGPNEAGVEVEVEFESAGERREAVMAKESVTLVTVPIATVQERPGGSVGYLYFSTFVSPSQAELDRAFQTFHEAGIQHLVVDLRYNGGGLVSIAHHLINLIVGGVAAGEVAYQVNYNENLSNEDSRQTVSTPNWALDTISGVTFLTTSGTASASELVINGVVPHLPVAIIGSTTAGKPVGSRHFEFCDSIAAPITFELLNADGFGHYYDGLPVDCAIADDLLHVLGDPDEGLFAGALTLMESGQCPATTEPTEMEGRAPARFQIDRGPPMPLLFPGIEELRGWM